MSWNACAAPISILPGKPTRWTLNFAAFVARGRRKGDAIQGLGKRRVRKDKDLTIKLIT